MIRIISAITALGMLSCAAQEFAPLGDSTTWNVAPPPVLEDVSENFDSVSDPDSTPAPSDSVGLTVWFSSSKEYDEFLKGIYSLANKYGQRDSAQAFGGVRIAPFFPIPVPGDAIAKTTLPTMSGMCSAGAPFTLHIPHTIPGDEELPFFSPVPGNVQCPFPLSIIQADSRTIRITLSPALRNSSGATISSLDLLNSWCALVKDRPALGRSLFRYVKGLDGFIAGREATIMGIRPLDPATLVCTLDRPDTVAAVRMQSGWMVPPALGCGPFAMGNLQNGQIAGSAQANFCGKENSAGQLILRLGTEVNPLVGISLGKIHMFTTMRIADVEYAQQKLSQSVQVFPWNTFRYFVSLQNCPVEFRPFLEKAINCEELLHQFVKASGSCDAPPNELVPAPDNGALPSGLMTLLVRSDDPVSVIIGQRILTQLSRSQLSIKLSSLDPLAYERALATNRYTLAVGVVNVSREASSTAQLHTASRWFNDETRRDVRLANKAEVPLFTIQEYAIARKSVGFASQDIWSMCSGQ